MSKTTLYALLLVCSGLLSGCATHKGAPAANVTQRAEILWDVWGVPHIYAKTDEDLFYALGWASMRNHARLMLRLYGQARGRAAEYWGEDWVMSDTQVRTLRIGARTAAALARQTPEFRRKLEAFVDGVNAFATAHPEKFDSDLARVLPVTTLDLLAHQQRSGVLPFALAAMGETAEAWRQRGSNAWVLGPTRSKNGHAMMIMNPHIPWGDAVFGGLFRIFEVDVKSPSVDFYGALQVGNPVVSAGFSSRLGFTGTVNTLDDADVYELKLVEGGYLFDGQVRKFDETREIVGVRKADGALADKSIEVRWSVHGPIMAQAKDRALAVRLAGLDQPFQSQQSWDIIRARDFVSWRDAVSRLQIPKSNLLYADADGHIFYLAGGRIPKRSSGDYAFWAGIVPGDTSTTLWTETLPMAELPQAFDPPSGWLQNANDPPWGVTEPAPFSPAQFPTWMSPRSLSFRAQRSLKMIESERFDFDRLTAAKLSTRSELADRVLDELTAAARAHGTARARRAADVLSAWDREADADSRGAVLFFAWADRFLKTPAFAQTWDAQRPRSTPDGLKNPKEAVALLDAAATEIEQKHGKLDVPFGDVFRVRWRNGVDLPANGASGKYGVFRVTEYLPDTDGKHRAFQGDTLVLLVEFGNPVRAQSLLSYGNASDPASQHDGDQTQLYAQKRLRPVWRTRAEIEANLEMLEVLVN